MTYEVLVEFDEQAKAVTAKVSIKAIGETVDTKAVLDSTKVLFDEAQKYALNKSMLRNR